MDSCREVGLLRGAGRRSRRGRLFSLRQRLGSNWSVRTRELLSGPLGDPRGDTIGEGSREDTVMSQEGEKGGKGCEKEKPGCGREDEKGKQ